MAGVDPALVLALQHWMSGAQLFGSIHLVPVVPVVPVHAAQASFDMPKGCGMLTSGYLMLSKFRTSTESL